MDTKALLTGATPREAREIVFLWLAALALVALGSLGHALGALAPGTLPRVGCLVVALGIWSGFRGVLKAALVERTLRIRSRMNRTQIERRHAGDVARRTAAVLEHETALARALAEQRSAIAMAVGLTEALLLILGTLLWGFGDLLEAPLAALGGYLIAR